MERQLHLGFHFKPTDEELMVYLYCRVNDLPSPGGFVVQGNLNLHFRIDQPPDIKRDGCLGRLYRYTDCSHRHGPGQITRHRRTNDRKGYWKATDGQEPVHDEEGKAVGYKQNFRFHQLEPGKKVSTWVMTEYTMYSNKVLNEKAICVLRNTKED